MAIAAGTNLLLTPLSYISESNVFMLSPTGRLRMWDVAADGYARGDGIAAVLLKRLSDAVCDGDEIRGVIRHTGFSHNGRTKGITMPSGAAQAALIKRTYAEAGLDVLHDTSFGKKQNHEKMFVGSIKTVVGHTKGTAGIAGVIKTCLALEKAQIPPNLHLNEISPSVALHAANFTILVGETAPWSSVPEGAPRRASVNSFGFGGTNAHAILESYDDPRCRPHAPGGETSTALAVLPFTFSAALELSLTSLLEGYKSFLSSPRANSVDLGDLGYTLACRRSAFAHRVSFAATTAEGLLAAIEKALSNPSSIGMGAGTTKRKGLATRCLGVFTGQGAQWACMGASLVEALPVASEILRRLEDSLARLPVVGDRPAWSLREEMLAAAAVAAEEGGGGSRVNEVALSQPLCTAVQIVLVDLLRAAGVRFAAVVGHLSGEMAAAYAAGFLLAEDAVRIAYYRGLCTSRKPVDAGMGANTEEKEKEERASMLAVGTTAQDALDLCEAEDMKGRISLACVNSPSSVTLSGDRTALVEAQAVFEAEGKFNRLLRVDKAYYLHYMIPCSKEYREALAGLDISVRQPDESALVWLSSSFLPSFHSTPSSTSSSSPLEMLEAAVDAPVVTLDGYGAGLSCEYWVNNMTNPVLFHQALSSAINSSRTFDFAVEIGPHPALKGPATETMQSQQVTIPDLGTCSRGEDDVVALARTLGQLWELLPTPTTALSLVNYQAAFSGRPARLMTNLPRYAWDHGGKAYWAEPRTTRNVNREAGVAFHNLLGHKLPDGNNREWRWLNLLREDELPWLAGHSLQGQTVFPTTGYVAMAVEAGLIIAAANSGISSAKLVGQAQRHQHPRVRSMELRDVKIRKAIAISQSGSEVIVSMTHVTRSSSDGDGSKAGSVITADFSCYSPPSKELEDVAVNCTAMVRIILSDPERDSPVDDDKDHVLPPRQQQLSQEDATVLTTAGGLPLLNEVDTDEFYGSISAIGFGYTGPFQGISRLRRRNGRASGTVVDSVPFDPATDRTRLLVHPAVLDSALQGVFAAYSHPGDERLWALHAPTHVDRVVVVPGLCQSSLSSSSSLASYDFDCFCTDTSQRGRIIGDIDLYTPGYGKKAVTFQGLSLVPLSPFTPHDNRQLFCSEAWYIDGPDGRVASRGYEPSDEEVAKAYNIERVVFFFLRGISQAIREAEQRLVAQQQQDDDGNNSQLQEGLAPHRRAALRWIDHLCGLASKAEHLVLKKEWLDDDRALIYSIIDRYTILDDPDFNMAQIAAGDGGAEGGSNILAHMLKDGALDRLYKDGLGERQGNAWTAEMVQQVAERHPRMDIIEIGAGTGGTTKGILVALGNAFALYTVTDVSAGFVTASKARFGVDGPLGRRMAYRLLNMTQHPEKQGFLPGQDGQTEKDKNQYKYNMVVAANVVHAAPDIGTALRHARALLRPGGYLVLFEITNLTTIRFGVYYCGTPGWWVGVDSGQPWGPAITLPKWDFFLKASGFTGVQTSVPALDDDFRMLRAPLESLGVNEAYFSLTPASPGRGKFGILVLAGVNVGGASEAYRYRMAIRLRKLLGLCYKSVLALESLNQAPKLIADQPANFTTIGLTDLDKQGELFRGLTAAAWDSLKRL
ncbi:polyketide synthase/peptide synthetase [Diaporthe helianthi]|uniref:Polyketide synthase 15 n=1 Tax=Diaporthe helianthi TaxID=158607 RepID=A0A1C1XN64_DIAHE|nr:polyketide synthase 15 [Diaporthe helianthi]POS75592.1 polyketide synthase/peptide synthetase [Diaporthe helianthi]